MTFGEKVKKTRYKLFLSQQAMAKMLCVNFFHGQSLGAWSFKP